MEQNKQNKQNSKKFDLKNLSHEQKVKYIGIVGIAIVCFSMVGYGYYSNNSDENTDTIEEMTNPEAELSKYNSKLEALNGKKDPNLANDLEATFAQDNRDSVDVSFEELDRQIANLGNSQPASQPQQQMQSAPISSGGGGGGYNGGGARSGGSASNSHNVYGNYDMWQTNEPPNSRIEYANKNNRPAVASTTQQPKPVKPQPQPQPIRTEIEYVEPVAYQPQPTQQRGTNYPQQVVAEPKQVRAKLISQGYATTGKSLSFILLEPTTIAGQSVKKGQVITGVAREQDNRLNVGFSSIKIEGKVYNASMELLGSDGMKGLPISQKEDKGNGIEEDVKNTAGNVASRFPVVGGLINSATRSSNKTGSQSIKLTSNITCYILIY